MSCAYQSPIFFYKHIYDKKGRKKLANPLSRILTSCHRARQTDTINHLKKTRNIMKKNRMTLQEHRLLREASQLLTFAEKMKTAKPKITPKASQPLANATLLLTRNVKEFLTTRYDFRYNLLTDETEFRHAGQRAAPFIPIGKRELNALCIEAHDEGIPCWDKDLSRYVYSSYIPSYHPFHLYMEELPAWDGHDRLTALAQRVSCRPLWVQGFHTWMLGLASQWMNPVSYTHLTLPTT